MPDQDCGPHCPFLNRSDSRCSDKFCLDHLQHAFEHCFGEYKACSVYRELLDERQERRSAAAFAHAGRLGEWLAEHAAEHDRGLHPTTTTTHAPTRLVQVTVSPQLAQLARGARRRRIVAAHHSVPAAGGPFVPPPPGF